MFCKIRGEGQREEEKKGKKKKLRTCTSKSDLQSHPCNRQREVQ